MTSYILVPRNSGGHKVAHIQFESDDDNLAVTVLPDVASSIFREYPSAMSVWLYGPHRVELAWITRHNTLCDLRQKCEPHV